MNITFLVGNGFDISVGIDTSYEKFYQWYLNKPSKNNVIKNFKNEIRNDISNGSKNWSDFEIGLGKFAAHPMLSSVNDFKMCYDDAHEKMISYLKMMQNIVTYESITEKDGQKFRENIYNFYKEMRSVPKEHFVQLIEQKKKFENINVKFISFNYTDILDAVVDVSSTDSIVWKGKTSTYCFNINPTVLHVHGTVDTFPILGVSDETLIENKEFLNTLFFKEMMVKSESVRAIQEYWYRDATEILNKSDIICIWGMSLGQSDKEWWKKIALWLKASSSRELIIYWHCDPAPSMINARLWSEYVNDVKSKFLGYSDLNENEITNIGERIQVVFNTEFVLRVPKLVNEKLEQTQTILDNVEHALSMI